MAGEGDGHDPWDDPHLKGIQRYFNNKTLKGRANVAIATYACLASYVVYRIFFKSKTPKVASTAGGGCVGNQGGD